MSYLADSESLRSRGWGVVLLGGGAVGAFLLLAAAQPPKWFFFLIFALAAGALLVIIPQREKFLLYLTVVLMTVALDFHPIYLASATTPWPVSGWRISLFEITFILLLVLWLGRLVVEGTTPIRFFPWVSGPFLGLWLLSLLSTGRSDLPLVIKLCTLWLVMESWLIFLYFANHLKERPRLITVALALLLAGALQSLIGVGQYLSGSTLGLELFGEAKTFMQMRAGEGLVSRVSGTFGHPNNLGGYLAMVLQLNLALLFAPWRRSRKVALAGLLLLLGTALLLTLSRGAWLAFSLGALFTLFMCLSHRLKAKGVALLLAGFLVVLFMLPTSILLEPMKRRLFQEDYGAAQARMPLAVVALNIIRHHPWLGVGLTNYLAVAPSYDVTPEAISYTFPQPVHNEFLLIGAELGLPALGLFLLILGVLGRGLWRASFQEEETPLPYVAMGLLGAFIAWGAFRLTDYHYVLLADPFWVLAGLSQGLIAVVVRETAVSTT
uniref:O-antigen ligase domain-containing protein n=1 Tax=Desulfobacca acetoxidans TaxID=60893 RepID=A0A7C5ENA0_9BACT